MTSARSQHLPQQAATLLRSRYDRTIPQLSSGNQMEQLEELKELVIRLTETVEDEFQADSEALREASSMDEILTLHQELKEDAIVKDQLLMIKSGLDQDTYSTDRERLSRIGH